MPALRTHARSWVVRRWILAVPLATAALAAAACSSGSSSAAPSSSGTSGSGATIQTAHTSLGTVLTDSKGITVYLFEADTGTKSTCYAACASAWPPVLTTGAPVAGASTTASLLGTTKRTDGKTQVTYAGHPLYYFTGSTKPGDVSGQGVNGFGANWDAVRANGAQAG